MEVKHIDLKLEVKENDKGDAKVFEAYGSTFGNVDSYDDVVMKGAFTETLQKRKPKILYQHDTSRLPAIFTAGEEDDNGLLVRGEFLDTTLGRDVYKEVKSGAINAMSIGYSVNESEYDERGVRLIKSVDLYEVSFVTFPANEQALVTGVKANDVKTIREFESFLRDAGYTKADATRIALHGFKTSEEIKRDADNLELTKSILNLTNKIKETSNV